MDRLTEMSCSKFTELLAAKEAVPGGGAVAAMAGALGVALCQMVGSFTKKTEDILALQEKAEVLRCRLLELVDADAAAFLRLKEAWSGKREMEAALLEACDVPLEVVARCEEALDLLAEMKEKGSRMLLSDVGCGVSLCRAAVESAAMNVYVNSKAMSDRDRADAIVKKMEDSLDGCRAKAQGIYDEVSACLRC